VSARAIIAAAAAEGVRLSLAPNGTVIAAGDRGVVERWLPEIRGHKAEVVRALRDTDELASVAWAGPVYCRDCSHFVPGFNRLHGTCGAGAAGTAGLWATDARACESWLPRGLADAVRAMADRWHYSADEREWALEQATQHPQEWLRMIEADMQGRRWPDGDGWLP
jgi:hypothetical protein